MANKTSTKELKRLAEQGQRLKSLRKGRDLSQGDIAKLLKTSITTFQNWEAGRNGIKEDYKKPLSEILNTSVSYILYGDEPPFPDNYKKIENGDFKTISNLEKEIAEAVLKLPQEAQDVVQGLIFRYQNDEQDGLETAKAIKKLMGIK